MGEETARQIAREVIGPCGFLGYFCGRGTWYPNDEYRDRWRYAVGFVMGYAYDLLTPVWKLHPNLNPGRTEDALCLAQRNTSLVDTPEDMKSLLGEIEIAALRAAAKIEKQLPASARFIRERLSELTSAIGNALTLLSEVGKVTRSNAE